MRAKLSKNKTNKQTIHIADAIYNLDCLGYLGITFKILQKRYFSQACILLKVFLFSNNLSEKSEHEFFKFTFALMIITLKFVFPILHTFSRPYLPACWFQVEIKLTQLQVK